VVRQNACRLSFPTDGGPIVNQDVRGMASQALGLTCFAAAGIAQPTIDYFQKQALGLDSVNVGLQM